MKLEINHRKRNEKKTDYMETKQHAAKKPMGQQGNQKIPQRQMNPTRKNEVLGSIPGLPH